MNCTYTSTDVHPPLPTLGIWSQINQAEERFNCFSFLGGTEKIRFKWFKMVYTLHIYTLKKLSTTHQINVIMGILDISWIWTGPNTHQNVHSEILTWMKTCLSYLILERLTSWISSIYNSVLHLKTAAQKASHYHLDIIYIH